jgi:RNA polymerase sigma-70 factor, ECF subfamily
LKEILKFHNQLDEDSLIKRAQQDPSQFRPIYEQYYKRIFVFALQRVREKEIAADVTSQVFLKALNKINQFQFKGFPFSSWLYKIAANECNQIFRESKRDRFVVLEDHHVDLIHEEMFGHDPLGDLKSRLPVILELLPLHDVVYIELRFLEERPFKEVAEIIGVSENYAKVKTYRILEKMKKLFLQK